MGARTTNGEFRPRARPAPMRSIEREKLHNAIAARDAAKSKVDATTSALNHARNSAADHRNAIANAKAEVAAAESRFADSLVAQARGRPAPAGMTIEEANRKAAELEATTHHFDAAIGVLERDLSAAQTDLPFHAHRVEEAVHAVMKADPHVRKLYEEYTAVMDRHQTLLAIVSELPTVFIRPDGTPPIADHPDYSEVKSWLAYVETLKTNPDAVYGRTLPHVSAPAHGRTVAG